MPGTFSNQKKLILLANAVEENLNYIKRADNLFGDLAGKKYGMAVHGYQTDAGSVSQGLVAHPDVAHQVEHTAWLDNYNTSAQTDLWDDLTNIADFNKEMVDKRSKKLARDVQKAIINENVFRSAQAVVATSAGYDLISDAAAALDELSVVGERVTFLNPNTVSAIKKTGQNLFLWPEKQRELYEDASIGVYAQADTVSIPGMPIVDTTGMDNAPTISGAVKTDADSNVIGIKPISTITGSGTGSVIPGVPYKVSGLKIVDEGGVETNQDYFVIPTSEIYYDEDGNRQTRVVIPELRISATGKSFGNPNAHIAASSISGATSEGVATFTLTPVLTASKHYQVGQYRLAKALSFSPQQFKNLPAAKQDNVGVGEFITLKMQSAPEILNGISYFRIDMPYVAKLLDNRQSVSLYLLLD